MQTIVRHVVNRAVTPDTDGELELLLAWELDDPARVSKAAVLSILVHAVLIGSLALMPQNAFAPPPKPAARMRRVTPLFDPPTELTQKAANKGKISKNITAEMVPDRPRIQAPPPAPSARRMPPPPAVSVSSAKPPVQNAVPPPPKGMPEPPKVAPEPPAQVAQLTLPQIQPPPEKPKVAFETPGVSASPAPKGVGRLAVPNPSIQEAVRNVARGGTGSGLSVGDSLSDLGAAPPGLNLPPSAGRPRANLELQSDPMGVDFRPYLLQVLQTVRRNWFAVYPESAKLGTRGMVNVTFSIEPSGTIAKAVITSPSGVRALDQAAVASLSASNPLTPLPSEFHGNRIILRFTFSYNIPVR
ncbi:MAG: TonB family protein [Acidobacteriota bacterium]|nr:TonB family protein [Acidobacteriota bacterium]